MRRRARGYTGGAAGTAVCALERDGSGIGELMRRGFEALVRLMVNLKFAVAWLLLMGALAVYGTVWLDGAASMRFFRGWLFTAVLLVFALALILAVLSRYPWKPHHIGWIATHAGLVVIVLGHLITAHGGLEGTLHLPEGGSADRFEQRAPGGEVLWELHAALPRRGELVRWPVPLERWAERPAMPLEGVNYDLPGGGRLAVLRYFPDFRLELLVEPLDPEGGPPNPAARVELTDGRVSRARWVFAEPRLGESWFGNALRARYLTVPDQQALQALLAPPEPSAGPWRGRIVAPGGLGEVAVEQALQAAVPLGQTGVQVRVRRHFERLRVIDNQPVEAATGARNPAVELELTDGEQSERVWLFAAMPELNTRPRRLRVPWPLTYEVQPGPAGALDGEHQPLPPSSLVLVQVLPRAGTEELAPDGEAAARTSAPPPAAAAEGTAAASLVLVVTSPAGERQVHPFALGQAVPLPWLGPQLRARVTDRFDRVQVRSEPGCASYEPRRPALEVRLEVGGESAQGWVRWNAQGQPTELHTAAGGPVRLLLTPREIPLGFELELVDFVLQTHEGTELPRSYESFVRLPEVHGRFVTLQAHEVPAVGSAAVPLELAEAARVRPGATLRVGGPHAFYYAQVEAVERLPGGRAVARVRNLGRPVPLRPGATLPAGSEVLEVFHIFMNHPLVHRGFTFYQADYDKETLAASVFQVSYDPGWPVTYAGYAITVLGLLFIVYVKPVLLRREARRRAEAALLAAQARSAPGPGGAAAPASATPAAASEALGRGASLALLSREVSR
ncbi:MAG: hypothetical protein KatS3mg102_1991 [Planctomycetota bacterium]|nr:MAG: hypothetical protein KatS3mg102_1991 [Planctomycetota bacterium]